MSNHAADALAPASDSPGEPGEWDWSRLYAAVAPGLIALGMRRYGMAPQDCEDAFQKAAIQIADAGPVVRNREAYLTTVFLRECWRLAKARDERRRREVPLEDAPVPLDDPTSRVEAACRFNAAMSRVPERCRQILQQWAIEGRSRQESAESLGWSKVTVYRRFARCMKRLVDALG